MKNPVVILLLLVVVPMVWAAPKAEGQRAEVPAATGLDPDPDLLSPELPMLQLLQSTVRSLGPPEWDVQTMTREQALLYLFVLHDHDQSGHLDGLELLQLLSSVLVPLDSEWLDPYVVVPLVDQVLERQDLNKDGLVNPPELLFLHSRGQGPLGQPHVQRPGESLAEAGAVLGGDAGVSSPGHGPAEGQMVPPAAAPNAEGMEVEEASEIEAPEGEAAPVLGEPGEG
ncbi:cell growth regulator with EF hand domain protein 1 isoform X2 [Falco naumanni]|uniref:cell growth regulator with EF hand domain protein 1 isoform X2 n=1 Tax=Falco naumanni TaxID=148594 RepID=UPI001ADE1D3B|nr:cell growth regulator with EF hand domain protein 1 isoform X2 [Falco naumanni]XP_040454838.1 cell growth regulator with EF hand domain protein 1 isoform X2 [Falco naumanni]XP_040454839.1 cell growth regulator with EF hand domain protein 1 isoform X2 [Falco naumanni]